MMSTGFRRDQLAGSTESRRAMVFSEIGARVPPPSTRASVAMTPGPPPLVTMARRLLLNRGVADRVSTASNISRVLNTRNMPARRMAAS